MHNIICFGDSITAANNFAETDRWPTVLGSMLEEWAPESFRVFNRGIGGNTSAQGLNRLESDALAFLPGTVLIEFGLNDANVHPWLRVPRVSPGEFRRNLREMHRAIRERKGEAVFIVNHTISRKGAEGQGNGKAYATNFKPYSPITREVAAECDAPLIDLPKLMKKAKIKAEEFNCEDGVHLTVKGNRQYAGLIMSALRHIL